MIRFIDLRGQYFLDDDEPKEKQKLVFAFLDTTTDKFSRFNDDSVWTSVENFIEDYDGRELDRYLSLIPDEFKQDLSKVLIQARCQNCNKDVFVKTLGDHCPECQEIGFLTTGQRALT